MSPTQRNILILRERTALIVLQESTDSVIVDPAICAEDAEGHTILYFTPITRIEKETRPATTAPKAATTVATTVATTAETITTATTTNVNLGQIRKFCLKLFVR